jgi:DNA modification methylase
VILVGDCRDGLRSLEAGSVQTCVTSPPYFGLRDYGNAGQIGLEPTPDEFVAALVDVFREVRRVLRDDGTVWLNLGDSFFGGGYSNHRINGEEWLDAHGGDRRRSRQQDRINANPDLKPKDLIGIPWAVAFALRADGWYLRSDIIWAKPNPMPESVTDRPTKAHEYLFLLSKGPRYFYDADAIREEGKDWSTGGPGVGIANTSERYGAGNGGNGGLSALAQRYKDSRGDDGRELAATGERHTFAHPQGRNKRSVWTVATQPYAGAHFATFPPKLIEPCILAGSAPGGVVLDPFAGAGTVGVVCGWHGREHIGLELNPEYAAMAEARIALEGRPGGRPSHHEPVSVVAEQLGLL